MVSEDTFTGHVTQRNIFTLNKQRYSTAFIHLAKITVYNIYQRRF